MSNGVTCNINATAASHNRKRHCFAVRKWSASIMCNLLQFVWERRRPISNNATSQGETLKGSPLSSSPVHPSLTVWLSLSPLPLPKLGSRSFPHSLSLKALAFRHRNLSVCCPLLCSSTACSRRNHTYWTFHLDLIKITLYSPLTYPDGLKSYLTCPQ